jgi:RIO kinase 2
MGQKNHEYVPEQLVESIAHLRRCGVYGRLQVLIKHGLLHHEGGKADGYKLTYNGYDCLALRALTNRELISQIGTRIGVGKESDIHMCSDMNGNPLVVKFHRLGRISFRTVKSNRDYLEGRSHASWMYMARLAARKEFQYMQALYEAGFPVPKPIDNNRHAVLMEYMDGSIPLYQVPNDLPESQVEILLNEIFKLLVRFVACGLIHGDYNEFNILINLNDIRRITVIDFPQIISVEHSEAQNQFERDVGCIVRFFKKRFRFDVESPPTFDEAMQVYRKNLTNNSAVIAVTEEDNQLGDLISSHQQIEEDGEDSVERGDSDVESDQSHGMETPCDSSDSDEEEAVFERRPRKKDEIIQDPRHLLRAKKKKERKEAAPKVAIAPKPGRSHAKPNKQKRGQHSHAAREVKAWKSEGGW